MKDLMTNVMAGVSEATSLPMEVLAFAFWALCLVGFILAAVLARKSGKLRRIFRAEKLSSRLAAELPDLAKKKKAFQKQKEELERNESYIESREAAVTEGLKDLAEHEESLASKERELEEKQKAAGDLTASLAEIDAELVRIRRESAELLQQAAQHFDACRHVPIPKEDDSFDMINDALGQLHVALESVRKWIGSLGPKVDDYKRSKQAFEESKAKGTDLQRALAELQARNKKLEAEIHKARQDEAEREKSLSILNKLKRELEQKRVEYTRSLLPSDEEIPADEEAVFCPCCWAKFPVMEMLYLPRKLHKTPEERIVRLFNQYPITASDPSLKAEREGGEPIQFYTRADVEEYLSTPGVQKFLTENFSTDFTRKDFGWQANRLMYGVCKYKDCWKFQFGEGGWDLSGEISPMSSDRALRIVLVGTRSVGKTAYLGTLLNTIIREKLFERISKRKLTAEFNGERDRMIYRELKKTLYDNPSEKGLDGTEKGTVADVGVTIRHAGRDGEDRRIHLYFRDMAGEHWAGLNGQLGENPHMAALYRADVVVLLYDPTQCGILQGHTGVHGEGGLDQLDLFDSMDEVFNVNGIRKEDRPDLSVLITKSDTFQSGGSDFLAALRSSADAKASGFDFSQGLRIHDFGLNLERFAMASQLYSQSFTSHLEQLPELAPLVYADTKFKHVSVFPVSSLGHEHVTGERPVPEGVAESFLHILLRSGRLGFHQPSEKGEAS